MRTERSYSIGREKDCDVVIADETVSRKHATLTFQRDGGMLLTDCHSVNGTFVHSGSTFSRIQHARVSPDRTIKFGDIIWTVGELLDAIHKVDAESPIAVSDILDYAIPKQPPHGGRLTRCKQCQRAIHRNQKCPYCGTG